MFFFDPLQMLIIVVSMILSGGAAWSVKSKFARGKKVRLMSRMSGREVAELVLRQSGISNVTVVRTGGFLSDYYNPMTHTLALSPDVYDGSTAAAAGVAAHEAGHAIQHAHNYAPLWLRSTILPVANIGSNVGPWLIFIGIILGATSVFGHFMLMTGVVLFAGATLFTVITVPVEFNASSRAKERLMSLGIINRGEEEDAVKGVLTAAGLTYVAAAVTSIMWLLYYLMRSGLLGGRSDD